MEEYLISPPEVLVLRQALLPVYDLTTSMYDFNCQFERDVEMTAAFDKLVRGEISPDDFAQMSEPYLENLDNYLAEVEQNLCILEPLLPWLGQT